MCQQQKQQTVKGCHINNNNVALHFIVVGVWQTIGQHFKTVGWQRKKILKNCLENLKFV